MREGLDVKHLTLLVFLLATGCESNKNITFYNPNKTPPEISMDEADCRNMARGASSGVIIGAGGAVFLASAIVNNNRQVDTYRDCMLSKGYVMITNAASSNSTVKAGRK